MRADLTLGLTCLCIALPCSAHSLLANQPPVAVAGPDRYLDAQPLTLDGSASFDPDPGDAIVTYTWTQLSGPALNIAGADTAAPTVTATPVANTIGTAVLQLVVNDGEVDSPPDTIQLTIVAAIQSSIQLIHQNPPFDPAKPTQVFFSGGNCNTGGGNWDHGSDWQARANVVTFLYGPPYERCADALIAFLSRVAPAYSRPIQTCGFSTGGMPAIDSAIRLNKIYRDPRYAVTIVNLLDAACRNYDATILDFLSNPVAGNAPWVQNFFSSSAGFATFRSRCLNVSMVGDHSLPPSYYLNSIYPQIFTTDIYNHGVVAGVFTSVLEHGANYRMPILANSPYYFRLVLDTPQTVHLEQFNAASYPGRLPQPIELTGPGSGEVVAITGTTLGCTTSENSLAYDLLMGPGPDQLAVMFTSPAAPSLSTGFIPPSSTLYWSLQARDSFGTAYRADARSLTTPAGLKVDINGDGQVDGGDCALIQPAFGSSWGDAAFHLAADYNADGLIDCVDYYVWLADYRAYYDDPTRPDPCGLTLTPDDDGDGIVDTCDACPGTVPGSPVDPHGCPPHIPGDFDGDGDVDQSDFGRFQACLGSPAPAGSACAPADLDASAVVNSLDTTRFVLYLLGPDTPGNPTCAD